MPGSNLTRTEAAERAKLLEVQEYAVELDLRNAIDEAPRTFRSRTRATFTCRAPGATTFIDLIAENLIAATLNGAPIEASDFDPKRGLTLRNLAAENLLEVEAECYYMNTGEGMHRFRDPADSEVYLYTQFEAREAGRVYACFDQPDLKARFSLTVQAPAGWRVFSNGVSTQEGDTWSFATTVPMPTYITAIVAGPYVGQSETHDGIDLGIWCRRSMLQYMSGSEAEEILTVTKQGFDFFHEKFQYRYPFGKYDQIFVGEFNAGAMENAGCVTHSDEYMLFRGKQTELRYESRANTILHEMAHMWFGDLVTMRWWDDLWLNESFAEWASHWASVNSTKYTQAWTGFATTRKAWGMRQDQLSSTHPVATDAPDVETAETNFDGITYAKGAAILKQLVAYVGEETFVTALRAYFREHEYSNATLADLLGALEKASGRDLALWSHDWLRTANLNTLRPEVEMEGATLQRVAIAQSAPADYPTLRPHRVAIGLYEHDDAGALTRTRRVEFDIPAGASLTEVPELAGVPTPALLLVNDDDLTFAKIRLDPASLATAIREVASIDDPLARALCWGAAWDMNRDAELPTRQYVQMAIDGLPTETTMGVIQGQLAFVVAAIDRYADPAWVATGYSRFADAAWDAARACEAGSDAQLVWVRAFSSSAHTDEQHAHATALLAEEPATIAELPGLALDPDLRWQLLSNLVAAGHAGEPEIVAESRRDNTDQGARFAATARALIPTAEAKAAAWSSVVESDALPNQTALAVIRGFGRSEHAHLLTEYVDKYFACLPEVWKNRTSEVATNITEGLFPSWEVAHSTVERTDAYLADHPELPSAARRTLAEGRDGLVRALAARACDADAASR